MIESVLTVEDSKIFRINPNPGFIHELDFTVNTILNANHSEFIEAKANSYIHYQICGKEIVKYFGHLVDGDFYWGGYPVAKVNKDKIQIIIPEIIMEFNNYN